MCIFDRRRSPPPQHSTAPEASSRLTRPANASTPHVASIEVTACSPPASFKVTHQQALGRGKGGSQAAVTSLALRAWLARCTAPHGARKHSNNEKRVLGGVCRVELCTRHHHSTHPFTHSAPNLDPTYTARHRAQPHAPPPPRPVLRPLRLQLKRKQSPAQLQRQQQRRSRALRSRQPSVPPAPQLARLVHFQTPRPASRGRRTSLHRRSHTLCLPTSRAR